MSLMGKQECRDTQIRAGERQETIHEEEEEEEEEVKEEKGD